jgi:hypothetical protein
MGWMGGQELFITLRAPYLEYLYYLIGRISYAATDAHR